MNTPLSRGFTLVEVLVALAIVATTLIAGLQATASMTRMAERQSDRVLAQICAENALTQIRLERQFPNVGESIQSCTQAGRELQVQLVVQPTPNPNFRRVQTLLSRDGTQLLELGTVVGRF